MRPPATLQSRMHPVSRPKGVPDPPRPIGVATSSLAPVGTTASDAIPSVPPSAAPPIMARVLAFVAVLVAGACGGLVGYAVTDLQCADGCTMLAGSLGVLGAVGAAVGVGIVATLTLRAMAEWRTNELQQAARDHHPIA